MTRRVVVALSGGVDSSVAAALLQHQGFEVIGVMMRLWSEPGTENENRCCTPDSMAQARKVAAILDIPFYALDAQAFFYETIVNHFIEGYAKGVTPNPCLVCNRFVRWDFLLKYALSMGADFMATGHYVRLTKNETGLYEMRKAVDNHKDQSYVLHVLQQNQLQHALFPLGDFTKTQVRGMAHQFKLPIADRPDSQDLCFLGNEDYRTFLQRNAPQILQPGPIVNTHGSRLGEHNGLPNYTIGQRKGLGISSAEPLYVIAKDIRSNTLTVGYAQELGQQACRADRVNWISGSPPSEPLRAQVKIRYKAHAAWGLVEPTTHAQVNIRFDDNLRDITPGQAAVFYQDDLLLGGGIILP